MSNPGDIPALATCLTTYGVNTMSDTAPDDFEEWPVTVLPTAKFSLGQVQIAVDTAYELDRAFVEECLRRHSAGDWGEVEPETESGTSGSCYGEPQLSPSSRNTASATGSCRSPPKPTAR